MDEKDLKRLDGWIVGTVMVGTGGSWDGWWDIIIDMQVKFKTFRVVDRYLYGSNS